MVKPAQEICDRLTSARAREVGDQGRCISCRKGCDACCYYVVPVSQPEAANLWRAVCLLPDDKRARALQRFDTAARAILAPGDTTARQHAGEVLRRGTLDQISKWYRGLNLPCPLLEDGACMIYADRPLACREYAVTSLPALCGTACATVDRIYPDVSVAESLQQLSAQAEGRDESILLPLLALWAQDQKDPAENHRFPATVLHKRLMELIAGASRRPASKAG